MNVTRSKLARVLTAALAGGSLLNTCQTRIKEAAVQGLENFVLTELLNPANLLPPVSADATENGDPTGSP